MKILLDERNDFPQTYDIWTVRDKGWLGKKNGELLQLMTEEKFEIFITVDQNLPYQQNIERFEIVIVVLCAKDSRRQTLGLLIPKLVERLAEGNLQRIIEIS